jgi:hypothetical protein
MAHPTRIVPDHNGQQQAHRRSGSSSISILQNATNVKMGAVSVSHQHGDVHDYRASNVHNDHSIQSNTLVDQKYNTGTFYNGPVQGSVRKFHGIVMAKPAAGGKPRRESAPVTSASPAGWSMPQQENSGEAVNSSRDIILNRTRLSAQRFHHGREGSVIDQRWNEGTMFNEGCLGSVDDYQDYIEGYNQVPEGFESLIIAKSSIPQGGYSLSPTGAEP